jgi:hypothetical protein
MKVLGYVLAVPLGLLGLLFVVAAGQGNAVVRIAIGFILIVAAVALVVIARLKPTTHVHQMKLDLPGDVALEQLTCRQCGASLNKDSVTLAAGALVVHCDYCGGQYQMEEAPKW